MNKKTGLKIGMVILLVLMAGISFGPCLKDAGAMFIGVEEQARIWFPGYCNYLPTFFGIVSLMELILIFVPGKKILRITGILLTIVKLAFPMIYYAVDTSGKNIGDVVLVSPDIRIYPPTVLGYVLYALGLVTVILYVVAMVSED